jgi:hypothetical protein
MGKEGSKVLFLLTKKAKQYFVRFGDSSLSAAPVLQGE